MLLVVIAIAVVLISVAGSMALAVRWFFAASEYEEEPQDIVPVNRGKWILAGLLFGLKAPRLPDAREKNADPDDDAPR